MLRVKTIVDASTIHGIGLFAAQNIRKGQIVWEFRGQFDLTWSDVDFQFLPEEIQDYCRTYAWESELNKHASVWLLSGDNARFINSSKDPNTAQKKPSKCCPFRMEIFLPTVATRDIAQGEEITEDYEW